MTRSIRVPQSGAGNEAVIPMGQNHRTDGTRLTVDGTSLLCDGRRYMPVMGEFHFSRYDEREWRAELLKMKAGGIDIIATYVFWIHHEEIEGDWDWSGQRSLRGFAKVCSELDLQLVVRCGPWGHGECRNGGFPEWLLTKGHELRSLDAGFMSRTRNLYAQIEMQLRGFLWKDGGAVIGIQLDNEYKGRAEYLLELKAIAQDVGLDVPLYTRTGWPLLSSPLPYGQILPLYGSYGDGFWDRELTAMPSNFWSAFVFSPERLDTADFGDRFTRPPNPDDMVPYPFFTCEIWGGIEPAYHRRIRVTPEDVLAVSLVKLGSGGQMLGYYMYHGGTHPDGKLSTLQEAQNSPMTNLNDMPVKSYDFNAPLGQFGQVREQYGLLRRLHLFAHDFGTKLLTMPASFPSELPHDKTDSTTLRWSVRSNGTSGFLFVNNYQRLLHMPEKPQVQFNVDLASGFRKIPTHAVQIPANSSFFWPFNLDLTGVNLAHSTAQPMCEIDDGGIHYTFFAQIQGVASEFVFDARGVTINASRGTVSIADDQIFVTDVQPGNDAAIEFHGADGKKQAIVLLDDAMSPRVLKARFMGLERVLLAPDGSFLDGDSIHVRSSGPDDLAIDMLPAPRSLKHEGSVVQSIANGVFWRFVPLVNRPTPVKVVVTQTRIAGPPRSIPTGAGQVAAQPNDVDFESAAVWHLKLPRVVDLTRKLLLRIRYVGDVARIYLNGNLITDNFYTNGCIELGVNRFGTEAIERGLTLKILPLRKDAPIYLESAARPDFSNRESVVALLGVDVVEEVEAILHGESPRIKSSPTNVLI